MEDPESIRSLVREFRGFAVKVKQYGSSWGMADEKFVIEIPYIPIKAPSEFDKRILELLKSYGWGV